MSKYAQQQGEAMHVEIAVHDAAGAEVARRGGADRIELCAGLDLGGLTPSLATISQAVATGIGSEQDTQAEVSTLLPAAPRSLALQVLERVLGIPADDVPLAAHPAGARTRRLRWAGILAAALAGCWLTLFALGLPAWLLILTAAIFAPAVLAAPFVALDAAANLGHALTDELLASRHGSIRRSTVLLYREGIIGWQLRQSVFQRRLNLASVVAVTAAGRGRYAVVDADTEQVRTLAEHTVADLLEPRAATAPVAERTVGPPEAEGPTVH